MSKTILIADDDAMITQLFHLGFEQAGHDVHVKSATSGELAISALEEKKPDVLVLDIKMPNGDGMVVLEHVKNKEWDLPVIILTNVYDKELQDQCLQYGVRDYLIKHEHKFDHILAKVCACFDA